MAIFFVSFGTKNLASEQEFVYNINKNPNLLETTNSTTSIFEWTSTLSSSCKFVQDSLNPTIVV
jgi:hypothetical protein